MAAQTFVCTVIYLVSLVLGILATLLTGFEIPQPLIWVTSTTARIVLATLGIFLDYLTKYAIGLVIFHARRQLRKESMRSDTIDTETGRAKGLKGVNISVHIPGAYATGGSFRFSMVIYQC